MNWNCKTYCFVLGPFLAIFFSFNSVLRAQDNYSGQRQQMVRWQIEARGITNKKVIQAFRHVERHRFVLPEFINEAYDDCPLPIDEGQTISQPYIVAYMTDVLELKPTDKVLEIGTGSGYQAAILAQICDSVYTIELFETLGHKAKALFSELGYNNIYCKIGDGYKGWPEHAPFDAIIVTCSPTHVPQPLKEQLAEGGRMIIPVGKSPFQNLVLLEKKKGKIREDKVLLVRFVPMLDEEGKTY
ncbi:protein-L-isoaspartate(D-aspartate) O-methyltransferase [Prolixibacteraceae bacterium Z1-6]|uniref:Protein-L-isoaspartate O-methyltransferase n=1 Tax=Draconibacterium aestuarii TaxID=2998507 RepID=A0A9X3J655_9BACT|nr:protein-L-isoaspartate(D-aspartate) O-methyltransferase [Prolixibacteraceae bacterium Z1-6]